MKPTHAFLSVTDAAGVVDFARELHDRFKMELLAPALTANYLREHGVPAIETSTLFAFEDGRDPLLRTLTGQDVQLVVVTLPPPFRRPPAELGFDLILDGIDRVGPGIARSAIVRYRTTCVVMNPDDFQRVVEELLYKDDLDLPLCRKLARRALTALALYEGPLMRELTTYDEEAIRQEVPEVILEGYQRLSRLRVGSNKQQEAWLYRTLEPPNGTLPTTMSFNPSGKLTMPRARDAALATELLAEMPAPTALLLARQRPIAVASASTLEAALDSVLRHLSPELSDAVIALNGEATASVLARLVAAPMDMLVAPSFDPDALEPLVAREGLVLLATGGTLPPDRRDLSMTLVPGAALVEQRDTRMSDEIAAGDAGVRALLPGEQSVLAFAWTVAKFLRSDGVVVARVDHGVMTTVGIGQSATSRRQALQEALKEASGAAVGAVLASDGPIVETAAFERIASAGVVAMAHPGGPEDGKTFAVNPNQGVLAIVATNRAHIRY